MFVSCFRCCCCGSEVLPNRSLHPAGFQERLSCGGCGVFPFPWRCVVFVVVLCSRCCGRWRVGSPDRSFHPAGFRERRSCAGCGVRCVLWCRVAVVDVLCLWICWCGWKVVCVLRFPVGLCQQGLLARILRLNYGEKLHCASSHRSLVMCACLRGSYRRLHSWS